MRVCVSIFLAAVCLTAEERATITGNVTDAAGKPVEHATVLVYEAGVKKGYSVYCPTCYVDCGKHVFTDAEGNYTIGSLAPDLLFTLLVVREGYAAAYVKKADPAKGPAENALLKPRPPVPDASQAVLGRVVDARGKPLRDAVVEQQGIIFATGGRSFGPNNWIDQMAVTNENGEFELAYSKPAAQMILQVSARGMAPKLFTESTGADRKTMTVTDGATIRGRLMRDGKPVANAEVGLATHRRMSGTTYSEVRIGTKEDGTFAITNVPAGRVWNLYPKMESLSARGIGAQLVECETKDDGQEVNVGDIQLQPGYSIRGKVVLSDGKAIPPDMHVTLSADRAWDSQIVPLGADGSFEFHGLPKGVYDVAPGVKGYRTPEMVGQEVMVHRDVAGVVIMVEPVGGGLKP